MKKSTKRAKPGILLEELIDIMARLRGPEGCPWDKHQNHESLIKYLFSEAREVKLAVKNKDWKNLEEELGDVLLQIVFQSQVAEEAGEFDIRGVITSINEKLIRRHPHVFSAKGRKARQKMTPEDVVKQWKEIKKIERRSKVV